VTSLLAAFGLMLAAAFLIVLPRSKGCLAWLTRFPALLAGSIGPLVLMWPRPFPSEFQLLNALVALVLLVVSVAALTLIALGWQVILNRNEGAEEALPISLFDPNLYFGGFSTLDSNASIDSCLVSLVVIAIGSLFILGLLLAGVVEHYLLPDASTAAKKALRVFLTFAYGIAIQVGIFFLLNSILVERLTGMVSRQ
jgi:hypothetical protein